jgi:MFS family permease
VLTEIRQDLSWAARSLGLTLESRTVCQAALVQGFLAGSIPAVGAVLTAMRGFSLTGVRYGEMYLPELAAAIPAALTGFGLSRRVTTRLAYRIGLALSLLGICLLLTVALIQDARAVAYPLMWIATALLGAGFGLAVPILFAYARFLHAAAEDLSVIAVNGFIGLGAIAAPFAADLLASIHLWWVVALLAAGLLVMQLVMSSRLPASVGARPSHAGSSRLRALRFFCYAVFVMCYAICAVVMVIWAQLRMTNLPVGPAHAQLTARLLLPRSGFRLHPLAFATFWSGTLIGGRVLLAAIDRWTSARARAAAYLLPIFVLSAALTAGVLSGQRQLALLSVFGLAGLGCAALLPLTISAGQKDVTAITAALAGGIIAYQVGYSLVGSGLKPPPHAGSAMLTTFALAALVGIVMAALSFAAIGPPPATPGPSETTTTRGRRPALQPA